MKKIVYVYSTLIWIGFYGGRCFLYNQELDMIGKYMVRFGYIFFIASDTILSVSLWVMTNRLIRFSVMFTYYIAQFGICVGYFVALHGISSIIPF